MRPTALAASCAAMLLVFGSSARAAEPESEDEEKGESKAEAVKIQPSKKEPEGPQYPPPYSRWAVIGIGLATTAVAYGAAAGMSYAYPDAPGARDLRTPIAGPWMAIAHNGCAPGDTECSNVWIAMRTIAEMIGGLAQAGGLLVAMEGVFMPTQYASEGPARPAAPQAPSEPPPSSEPPKTNDKNLFWIPTPMAVGPGGVGVGVVGRF